MNWGFSLSPVWVLIIINFLFFFAALISRRVLFNMALIPADFLDRPWTLFTAMFMHSTTDFWHIMFNMIALYFFGRTLTMLVNEGKFLLVYFIGGIVGNVLFLLLNLSSYSLLIGASGAVYAVAGALVVMVPNMRIMFWGLIPMPLWVFVIVFLGLLSLPPFVSVGVAWQAHMGGLVTGLVAGYFFRKRGRYYR
ncbi:MAG: hypothetical protein A2144_11805 [Chloroflexi bacterium RBG_16_50_9]|nr:MAG: hypothetical protein A2144_11805 [Chloroflexi bacterium RBG_16_50_9]